MKINKYKVDQYHCTFKDYLHDDNTSIFLTEWSNCEGYDFSIETKTETKNIQLTNTEIQTLIALYSMSNTDIQE